VTVVWIRANFFDRVGQIIGSTAQVTQGGVATGLVTVAVGSKHWACLVPKIL
jgi:hypothetical protein